MKIKPGAHWSKCILSTHLIGLGNFLNSKNVQKFNHSPISHFAHAMNYLPRQFDSYVLLKTVQQLNRDSFSAYSVCWWKGPKFAAQRNETQTLPAKKATFRNRENRRPNQCGVDRIDSNRLQPSYERKLPQPLERSLADGRPGRSLLIFHLHQSSLSMLTPFIHSFWASGFGLLCTNFLCCI